MFIGDDGEVYSGDESDLLGDAELAPDGGCITLDPNIGFSSDEGDDPRNQSLVILRTLSTQPKEEVDDPKQQRTNLFHMRCKVGKNTALVIIDGVR